ncbi:hypothetical protein V8G54_011130, partial [Vigna mungo]
MNCARLVAADRTKTKKQSIFIGWTRSYLILYSTPTLCNVLEILTLHVSNINGYSRPLLFTYIAIQSGFSFAKILSTKPIFTVFYFPSLLINHPTALAFELLPPAPAPTSDGMGFSGPRSCLCANAAGSGPYLHHSLTYL